MNATPAMLEIPTRREEHATCALRWSAQNVLQQAWRIETVRENELVAMVWELRDVPREGA